MTVVGIIGSGNIGAQVARRAVSVGYDVAIANSRGPQTLEGLIEELGPRARAVDVEEAARTADVVVVAIPIDKYPQLPADAFAGKVVLDAGNYYPDWNGRFPALDDESTTTAELLQEHLSASHVVKAFSNIAAADITTDGQPAGSPSRRALIIAGDEEAAKEQATRLIDTFGFDVVDAGKLAEGWRYQRDTPAYGARLDVDGARRALSEARRYRDM